MSTYALFFSAVLGIDELFANISEGRERVRAGKVGAWEGLVFSDTRYEEAHDGVGGCGVGDIYNGC